MLKMERKIEMITPPKRDDREEDLL